MQNSKRSQGWSRRRTRRFLTVAVGLGAALLATACAPDAPQDYLQPQGEFARRADDLWNLVFPIAVIIFFVVEGVLIYAIIRFRHKPGREAAQFHGNTRLEVVLTAIPALILAGIAVPTVATIFELAEEPEGNVLNVRVVAHQFWWEYEYMDLGLVTSNEMHIPVGTPIRLHIEGDTTDQVDGTAEVIHSFWVPRLAGKQDVVPGRVNLMTIDADEPGVYEGQCTEFCGIGHAYMRLRVVAHEQADFDAWVETQRQPNPEPSGDAAAGAELFQSGPFADGPACSTCHAVEVTEPAPNAGPNLGNFAGRDRFASVLLENSDENLAGWLRDPAAVKPGAKMPDLGLTEDQIRSLIAYLRTLE